MSGPNVIANEMVKQITTSRHFISGGWLIVTGKIIGIEPMKQGVKLVTRCGAKIHWQIKNQMRDTLIAHFQAYGEKCGVKVMQP